MDGKEFYSRLIGQFNAYNLLAVFAISTLLGEDKLKTLSALSNLRSVDGRFQYVKCQNGPTAIVDYADTPDALENVLSTINKSHSISILYIEFFLNLWNCFVIITDINSMSTIKEVGA